MSTLVVAALQAPTLLNIWARSPKWRLEVAELGDHAELEETNLLRVPKYTSGTPEIVLVCAPSHVDSARQHWPRAKIVWVIHNARREIYPDWCRTICSGSVALARSIAATHSQGLDHEISVIVPAYTPNPRFSWRADTLWTMISRPKTRHEDHTRLLSVIQERLNLTVYGQDQPAGFLDDVAREYLIKNSSAYVSPLPAWSGFGLAEHEMLAAGVPLVGPLWGDLSDEMPREYASLGGGPEAWTLWATELAEREDRRLSALGPAFVAEHRTEEKMNRGIEGLLDTL